MSRVLGLPTMNLTSSFFVSIGKNGRTCASCHATDHGLTVTPQLMTDRFNASLGKDPVFTAQDGSSSPTADLSTKSKRQAAFTLLLTRGLIRVSLPVPAGADFEVIAVDDPYYGATNTVLSMFRRPLPVSNLGFLSAVMWDGRETRLNHSIHYDLREQANDAALTHAEKSSQLSDAERTDLSAFDVDHVGAQQVDNVAGVLDSGGASGGPMLLTTMTFTPGENDSFAGGFNNHVFTLFTSWQTLVPVDAQSSARRDIAEGERLFNERTFTISGVGGLNDVLGSAVTGHCSTCHDTPNVGNHSVGRFFDIGVTDADFRAGLPLYTIRQKSTGAVRQTTDPGRAMVTGLFADIGRIKPPILRGLPIRSPYFHNGLFADINDVIDFYDQRFNIGFTATEKRQLAAFLEAL
jgi:cytochrome c peroxidase